MADYAVIGYVTTGYAVSATSNVFSWIPSYTTSVESTPHILEAIFGDGYSQAVGNGINYNPSKWNIIFTAVALTTASDIMNFFITNSTATSPFTWTDPEGFTGRYKCKTRIRTYDDAGTASITATFEQVYF